MKTRLLAPLLAVGLASAAFAGPRYTLVTDADGGGVTVEPLQADYAPGQQVTLTAENAVGVEFAGWTGDAGGTTNPLILTMDGDKHVTATFRPTLANAVDCDWLVLTTGGNAPWFGQTATSIAGGDAAQSGQPGDGANSWMETTIGGPGILWFRCKVSSENGSDWLECHVDGTLQPGRISGEVDWHTQGVSLGTGLHTVRWRYSKDSAGSEGSDAAWLDLLEFDSGTTYVSWAQSKFTPEELADPAISGPTANPTHDDISNLLKYAFVLDPHTACAGDARFLTPGTGTHGLPSITRTADGVLRVEFIQCPGARDLNYSVEFGSDLTENAPTGWMPPTEPYLIVGYPDLTRVMVDDNPPPGATSRFARVKVAKSP